MGERLVSGYRRSLLVAVAVAALLGIPMLILQRWVAETRLEAIELVAAWFLVCGLGMLVALRRRRRHRRVAWATYLAILLGTVAVGYWTGFRDVVVDEEIVTASAGASGGEREQALGPAASPAVERPSGPVLVAEGQFAGADGHSGTGTAAVVQQSDGQRLLTFSMFDVDPGLDVDVYLVPGDGADVSDRVELGNLKGNVGDQQYEIPAEADLNRYATVVLWCKPFTVRIAVAQLAV